jgi:hypothetical protein
VYNQSSHRQEASLPQDTTAELAVVKVCKFLEGTTLLVSSDMQGYLNFYSITPCHSEIKNKLLVRKRFPDSEELKFHNDKIAQHERNIESKKEEMKTADYK